MSRIGRKPIDVPQGITYSVDANNVITVKGPKGQLQQRVDPDLKIEEKDGKITISRPTDQIRHRAAHGLYRTLISNMIVGVAEGYTRELELIGVGYKAEATGQALELNLGYSHLMMVVLPKEISVVTETKKGSNPRITLKGIDKQLIGHFAAKIRSLRGPEPYKGKGIRFVGEQVRRKAGKASAKK